MNLSILDKSESLAFFVNVYHLMMLHASLRNHGIPYSTFERSAMMRHSKYHIGGMKFSIDDVLNGILRGNRACPIFGRRFKNTDVRRLMVPEVVDPRVHFVISHINQPGPGVQIMKAEELDEQLQEATKSMLNQSVQVVDKTVLLPSFLEPARSDLGKVKDVVAFLEHYLVGDLLVLLRQVSGHSLGYHKKERVSRIKRLDSVSRMIKAVEEHK